jgi:hypothetical protein
MDWSIIPSINTGFSLVAFAIAAAVIAYRARLRNRAEIIKSASPERIPEAIAAEAEFFQVNVSGLPLKAQKEIVLAQIKRRERRELLIAGVALAVSALLALVAIFSRGERRDAAHSYDFTISDVVVQDSFKVGNEIINKVDFQTSVPPRKMFKNCRIFVSLPGNFFSRKTSQYDLMDRPISIAHAAYHLVEFKVTPDQDSREGYISMSCDEGASNRVGFRVESKNPREDATLKAPYSSVFFAG